VTGKQLLEGVKELVMHRFGMMGLSVLKYWASIDGGLRQHRVSSGPQESFAKTEQTVL
jgi:hypothetical protein